MNGRLAMVSGNGPAVMLVGSFCDLLLSCSTCMPRTESKKAQREVQKRHALIVEAMKKNSERA